MAERFKAANFQKIESQEDNALEKREFTERAYNNLMADVPLAGPIYERGELRQQEREQMAKGILTNAFILLDNYNFLMPEERTDLLLRENFILREAIFINNLTSGRIDWEGAFKNLFKDRVSPEDRQEARRMRLKEVK